MCISLNESDKIRVIDGTQNHVNAVFLAIQGSWPEGFQEQSFYSLSHQFKLRGYPFSVFFSNRLYTFNTCIEAFNLLISKCSLAIRSIQTKLENQ